MSRPFTFEKPVGMRDILSDMVYKKRMVYAAVEQVMTQWGYELVETPTLEYYDTVGGMSATEDERLFKLLDPSGRTLVLRPDMTAPIARVVASLLKDKPFPIRLSYQGNVFRAQEQEAGRNSEFPEVGIELIGEEAPDADAEVIALAVACLRAAGISGFTFTLGHIGLLHSFVHEVVQDREQEQDLKAFLHMKNVVGYRQYVQESSFTAKQKEQLLSLLNWRGKLDQLDLEELMLPGAESKRALRDLQELREVLQLYEVQDDVFFDLSLLSYKDYYTGIFFEGYVHGLGFPISSGGRYDHLLGQFNRPAPATGFTLKVDRILEATRMSPSNRSTHVLLTYTKEERKEAFSCAREMREKGQQVTLHRVWSKEDQPPILEQQFDQVIRFDRGGRKGE